MVQLLEPVYVIVVMCGIHAASSHSWLHCADYDDVGKTCRGWPRNFYKQPSTPLGQDVGRDIRPGVDVPAGLVCDQGKEQRQEPVTGGYNAQYPMTKLALGQKFMWTWPAKNHAQVGTQRGVQIFISKTPGGGDDFSHITSKEAWLQKYPKLTYTFSECNPPGPNIDRAECKGNYEMPTDLTPGIYTFMWWWEFNAGEYYNSCADVEVLPAGTGPTPAPTPEPTPVPTPAPVTAPSPAPNPTPGLVPCPAPGPSSTATTGSGYNPVPAPGSPGTEATGSTASTATTGGSTGSTGSTGSAATAGGSTGSTGSSGSTGYEVPAGGSSMGVVAGSPRGYSVTWAFCCLSMVAMFFAYP